MLSYLFWPNPPAPSYSNPKVIVLLVVCALLLAGSSYLKRWRSRHPNAVTRKLSRSWSTASLWFGLSGVFMTVCRVEGISYLSMRFLWVIWFAVAVLFIALQWKLFRMRHYEVVPQSHKEKDPMEKYLPKKKRK